MMDGISNLITEEPVMVKLYFNFSKADKSLRNIAVWDNIVYSGFFLCATVFPRNAGELCKILTL